MDNKFKTDKNNKNDSPLNQNPYEQNVVTGKYGQGATPQNEYEEKKPLTGIVNEAAGEVREHIGRAIGNDEMEQKGHEQEFKGKAQRAGHPVTEEDESQHTKDSTSDKYH